MRHPIFNEVDKKRFVFILGNHRSGSSLTSGLLYHSGRHLGHPFILPNKFNPRGYFESIMGLSININIIKRAANSVVSDPWHYIIPPLNIVTMLDQFCIGMMYHYYKSFDGIKDPRMCYTFTNWKEVLGERDFIVVHCKRDRDATVKSIIDRGDDQFFDGSKEQIKDFIEYTNRFLESSLEDVPDNKILNIEFNEFIKEPVKKYKDLIDFVGVSNPMSDEDVENFIIKK
jgi:hypothetical protein